MHEVLPKLNVNFFTGMPVKMKHGPHCYLIEYREGHPCPLVLGCGQGVKMYLRMDQIEADPDSENLSSFNKMFDSRRQKLKLQKLEE